MNVNDIVYLKSDKEKLMITWIVGVTENNKNPMDINELPDFQSGDIAVKYNTDKKATIPQKCLIEDITDLVSATNQDINVGNVVKHKLKDKDMTIIWIVGQNQESSSQININKMYELRGFEEGDVVCGFFDKKEYKTHLFKKGEVIKIYE